MKYKRLYLDSPHINPRKEGNAGFDLPAYESKVIECGEYAIISTGITVEIPEGWVGLVVGRSGLRFNARTHADDVGVIDSNYRGEIKVLLVNDGIWPLCIEPGDRIAQLVLVPCYPDDVEAVQELSDSNRGTNGFGSTGLKEALEWL